MFASTTTVAFSGIDVRPITTQVQIISGKEAFTIVGLGDKAITESKERVRATLHAIGLELPEKRITVNLAPADMIKEGSHYDLPIAMAIIASMGIIDSNQILGHIMMGELGLDASIRPVNGVLPAAIYAKNNGMGIICPAQKYSEATLSQNPAILAPDNLSDLVKHFKLGTPVPIPPEKNPFTQPEHRDMSEVKGQQNLKRILEIAAVGGHNVLMCGPPGAGKTMIAKRFPTILPPMSENEILQTSQIHSIAGTLQSGTLIANRPFRAPHHSATTPSLVGGGIRVMPGEISLAHNGVLFLDELPEFSSHTLESLRQPIESGVVSISRANAHITYPCRFQLIAAMNPCKCGMLHTEKQCKRAPDCALAYQAKISGPMMDRIDLYATVTAVQPWELSSTTPSDSSQEMRNRVIAAIDFQQDRFKDASISKNAHADGHFLTHITPMTDTAQQILLSCSQRMGLSARAYHRVIKISRSIADLAHLEVITEDHIAEAISYRLLMNGA